MAPIWSELEFPAVSCFSIYTYILFFGCSYLAVNENIVTENYNMEKADFSW